MVVAGCDGGSGQQVDNCEPGTAGAACEACDVGTYCAGGEAPEVPCLPDGYDHDSDPATACTAVTQCTASEYESVASTATTDRECTALTVCDPGTAESVAPTPTSDRVCAMCVSWQYCAGGDAPPEKCSLQHNDPTVPCATAVQVAAGSNHTCAIDTTGDLACWGNDSYGQATVPGGLGEVVQVAAGHAHTCVLNSAGSLTCWGQDDFGQVTVPGSLSNVVQIEANSYRTCAVDSAGGLTCWGSQRTFQ